MLNRLTLVAVAFALFAGAAAPAIAVPCRDTHGKFMKCPPKVPAKCRDAKGRFAKCGMPGAKPA